MAVLARLAAPDARPTTLALTTAAALSPMSGPPGRRSYVVNTGAGLADLPSGDHLDFTGAPLPAATTIAGAASVRVVATLDDPSGTAAAAPDLVDTNFVFHLYDVAPGGAETLVTRGYLKASHRRSHAAPERIPLGTPVEYTVPLWHVHYQVAAGHHLVLRLQSGEEECCLSATPAAAQPLLPLTVTVHTGRGASALTLPTIDE